MINITIQKRHVYALAALFIAFAVIIPTASWASHTFNDVPDDNTFHNDIDWLAAAGVTLGCNPPTNDEFCPKDPVTRETMSAFLKRLAENQVVDAGWLEGKTAAELESHAYHAHIDSFVSFTANATTDILELDLPAGTYMIVASGGINSNAGSDMPNFTQSQCSLVAGSSTQLARNVRLPGNGVGDTEQVSWNMVHTFDTDGSAKIQCVAGSSWSGNFMEPRITAVTVQSATVQPTTSGSLGDPNG